MANDEPDEDDARMSQMIGLLLAEAANGAEHATIVRVAIRAELMWRCPECRTPNYLNHVVCRGCYDRGA